MMEKQENEQELLEIRKIRKRTFHAFLGVFLIVSIGIGGKIYMDNKRFQDEMLNVVKSSQVKQIIEDDLKGLDSKSLTSEGIIKSYEINYNSVEHNPMGGIMFEIIIDNDNDLTLGFNIGDSSGKLKSGVLVLSEKLSDKLED